jgi:hypothetical protein
MATETEKMHREQLETLKKGTFIRDRKNKN